MKSKIESIVMLSDMLIWILGLSATAIAAVMGYDWKGIIWATLLTWVIYMIYVLLVAELVEWLSHRKKEA